MSTKERLGFFLTCSRRLVKLFLSNLHSSTSVLLSVDLFLRVCTTALDEEFFFLGTNKKCFWIFVPSLAHFKFVIIP